MSLSKLDAINLLNLISLLKADFINFFCGSLRDNFLLKKI